MLLCPFRLVDYSSLGGVPVIDKRFNQASIRTAKRSILVYPACFDLSRIATAAITAPIRLKHKSSAVLR